MRRLCEFGELEDLTKPLILFNLRAPIFRRISDEYRNMLDFCFSVSYSPVRRDVRYEDILLEEAREKYEDMLLDYEFLGYEIDRLNSLVSQETERIHILAEQEKLK